MASIPRSHRKAYGAHRAMSPQTKAQNVAASIRAHGYDVADRTTWQRYGLADNLAQQARVLAALAEVA